MYAMGESLTNPGFTHGIFLHYTAVISDDIFSTHTRVTCPYTHRSTLLIQQAHAFTSYSLPNITVKAEFTNIFKNRLDRFCRANQEIKFDWHSDISGIGSRSVNS